MMVCKDSRDRKYMLQMLDQVLSSPHILKRARGLGELEPQFDLSHLMMWVRGHVRGMHDGQRLERLDAASWAAMASQN